MKLSHLAVAGVAVLALLLSACGGSDDAKDADSDKSTTTTEAVESDSTQPTTTVADDEYSAAADEFTAAVTAAGDDLCALMAVTTEVPLPAPSNRDQVKAYFDANFAQLEAVAASRPPEQAAAINATLEKYRKFIEDNDYDEEKLSGPSEELEAIQSDPAFTDAMAGIQTDAAACAPGGATTEPTTGE